MCQGLNAVLLWMLTTHIDINTTHGRFALRVICTVPVEHANVKSQHCPTQDDSYLPSGISSYPVKLRYAREMMMGSARLLTKLDVPFHFARVIPWTVFFSFFAGLQSEHATAEIQQSSTEQLQSLYTTI